MRPFSLEQAKQGKKVVTRDGREFMYGAHNPNASKMERLVGWIGVGGGQLVVSSWSEEGKGFTNYDSSADLFMATEKKTVYIGLYKPNKPDDKFGLYATHALYGKREAEIWYSASATLIEVIEREIEV